MDTTKLSSKGQVIIPKPIRTAQQWSVGQELEVLEVREGILLKPIGPFAKTNLEDVTGCLPAKGRPKSEEEIQQSMKAAARKTWRDSD